MTLGGEAPQASSPDAVRALGEQLERCSYLDTSLHEALGAPEPLATLAALFGLGSAVPGAALVGLDAAALEAEGLLERQGERVRARLRISVWNGLLMAHDASGGRRRPDVVPGPREAAQTLAHLTVRRPGQTVLDIGCGCGPQALLAARHADRVVATDINPRAAALSRLSARLNGEGAIETRVGDLYEPVAGERFGLLVSNPPYVISPDADLLFRDSGLAPGELCRRIVAGAGEHLEEDGVASVLCSWGPSAGSSRWDLLRDWVAGNGCDACAISYGPQDVAEYAARWTALSAGALGAGAQAEAIARWVRFYAEAGIEAIWFGALVLRRRSGAENWFAGLDAARPPRRHGGPQLERIFAAHDALAGEPEEALLERALVPAAPHRLVHALDWDGAGYGLADIRLVLEDDIGVDGAIDPLAVHVLLALDGRPVRAVVSAVAVERGLDGASLAAGSLPSLRRLYERGFLVLSS
jgi:methylase of polypeptide subunit release factors